MSDSTTPMFAPAAPYHPSYADTLAMLPARMIASAEQIDVLRTFSMGTLDDLKELADFDYEERAAPGPEGAPSVVLSIFSPKARRTPAPVVYSMHGGGMVTGDRFAGIRQPLTWVVKLGAVVVSVEYRLAPEHPHPAPIEDCYAGLVWLAQHADDLGLDPNRIVLHGGSAGGGLAAGLTLMARDRLFPKLAGQLLDSPMLDDRSQSVSSHQIDNFGGWDRMTNEMGWSALLGEGHATRDVSAYAAPARATDLSGLPPAYITAAAGEVFRDEAVDYASRLWAAGGVADLHVYAGAFHGYTQMAPGSPVSQAAIQGMEDWLARMFE